MLSMTAMGRTDRAVLTGGAEPGDRVVLTKGAGIEAAAIGAVRSTDEPSLLLDGERFTEPEREALYALWDEE